MKTWYFIHPGIHTPSSGDQRLEISLQRPHEHDNGRLNFRVHVRHEVEFEPYGVKDGPVQPMAEIAASFPVSVR